MYTIPTLAYLALYSCATPGRSEPNVDKQQAVRAAMCAATATARECGGAPMWRVDLNSEISSNSVSLGVDLNTRDKVLACMKRAGGLSKAGYGQGSKCSVIPVKVGARNGNTHVYFRAHCPY